MKKEQLAIMSNLALKKKVKTQKFITGILIGLVIGMFVIVFIIKPEKGFSAMKILPFSFLPLVMISIINAKKLDKKLNMKPTD